MYDIPIKDVNHVCYSHKKILEWKYTSQRELNRKVEGVN
jgi:hypothetical protein